MQRIQNRWSQRVRRAAFAIGIAAFACATPALAQDASSAPAATPVANAAETPEAAAIRKVLEQRFPGAHISHVAKSSYFGLYEVMLDDNLVYTDPAAAYVFVGSMYDTATKQNLTEARSRKLNRVALDKLPYELAFKRVKGDGSRKLVIFSDADCPFCHRLETEIRNLDNVTIYTFLFPIDQLHPKAAQKSKQIWCSADKAKAWDAFFASGKLPDNKGDCGDPVAKTQALGQSLHINATPTLIFADGTMIPGALPLPQIEKEMTSAEAEAKKVAAAPPK
ncbi:MAG TPA: DsbC family protein [Casimicrobiaceae bacterium]|nr:DsbC family protein [Casimicrobiaceae bacterium]